MLDYLTGEVLDYLIIVPLVIAMIGALCVLITGIMAARKMEEENNGTARTRKSGRAGARGLGGD